MSIKFHFKEGILGVILMTLVYLYLEISYQRIIKHYHKNMKQYKLVTANRFKIMVQSLLKKLKMIALLLKINLKIWFLKSSKRPKLKKKIKVFLNPNLKITERKINIVVEILQQLNPKIQIWSQFNYFLIHKKKKIK